ncbi:COX15/CtaA family protein [Aureimonas jatrophae]|uniref:Heme A synthase n=1 Tax=Aureimonas jatrophae TaxID=1166073 RepID=A0A1H0GUK7_9HYPH|nr:COX15/CtaA family protein [Aureimonas jatrophae]MBB3949781.1 cytochrome c oxidase assembly protein subunit 15 [Aureimonas jatrophae]SDO10341.1 cytochrome c oxidase assembly protein subunit 15 [Aureimonas jatrophae]
MSTLALPAFDHRTLADPRIARNRQHVRRWLYAVALLIVALVVVGGATRLTESGLSITEWKPIHGVVPPLSAAEWQEEFDLYKQIPQYQVINRGMSLGEFKTIYWWEWAHRFLARSVGFAFAVPLALFWLTGRLERWLKPRLVFLLALGGIQGGIGWWMVASGLVNRTDVSQYRLAVHLTMACIIFASTLWIARGLQAKPLASPAPPSSLYVGILLTLLALTQIYLGGLVAGLNAGLSFNTWPLMDGQLIPANLFVMSPAWRNMFENVMTVQFVHRAGAYLLFMVAAIHAVAAWMRMRGSHHAKGAAHLAGLVTIQASLGITTLLLHVPIGWALLHQAGALAVLAAAVFHARDMRGAYPVRAMP